MRDTTTAGSKSSGRYSGPPPTPAVSRAAAPDLEALAERLREAMQATDAGDGRREPTGVVDRASIVEAARYLRDERGYQLLRSVTAVDFLRADPRFHVVYHFSAIPAGVMAGRAEADPEDPARLLCLKVPLPAEDPVVDSLTPVYPTANWHERETYDMFGIDFAGHPDLRRILMPTDYEGFPLRKDHPQKYEEVAFSFNQEEVYSKKPFAKE